MDKRILFLIILVISSCSDAEKKSKQVDSANKHQPDSNAVRLNNKAISFIGKVSSFNGDSLNNLLYDSALIYYNQAIELDSLYLMAYTNKARVLQRRGLLEPALEILYKVQTIRPNFAEVIMGQGFLYEKMGSLELADKKYREALEAFENRLEDDPENDKAQSDIAFLYIFLENENIAIDEIQSFIRKNPESEQLKMTEGIINNFDREKFIKEY